MAMMDGVENGYTLSKFVGEMLVLKCGETSGIPVAVYRPGFISSHTKTGFSNIRDVDNRLLRGIHSMKMVPSSELTMEMAPVDSVAAGILTLSEIPRIFKYKIVHMSNDDRSLSWNAIVSIMKHHPKLSDLQVVPFLKWKDQLQHITSDNPLFPIAQSHFGGRSFPGR